MKAIVIDSSTAASCVLATICKSAVVARFSMMVTVIRSTVDRPDTRMCRMSTVIRTKMSTSNGEILRAMEIVVLIKVDSGAVPRSGVCPIETIHSDCYAVKSN